MMIDETRYIQEQQAQWFTPQRIGQLLSKLMNLTVQKFQCTQFTDWINLPLNTSGGTTWENYETAVPADPGIYGLCRYRKIGDKVELEGLARRTSGTGAVIATLPVGYRPQAIKLLTSSSIDLYCEIRVYTNGTINLIVGSGGWVSLDGLSFSTL